MLSAMLGAVTVSGFGMGVSWQSYICTIAQRILALEAHDDILKAPQDDLAAVTISSAW